MLRKERRDAEVNVSTVARLMGLSRQTVHRIEKGTEQLGPERIKAYRRALEQAAESKG